MNSTVPLKDNQKGIKKESLNLNQESISKKYFE